MQTRSHTKRERMSTIQLLSYQASLYSQTSMYPKQTTLSRGSKELRNVDDQSRQKHSKISGSKSRQQHTILTDPIRSTVPEGQREGGKASKKNWRKDRGDQLNWQQTSMLASRKSLRESDRRPVWAFDSDSSSEKQASTSLPASRKNSNKNDQVNQQNYCKLLPPLRFSSAPGKSAWRFVLPSPNPSTPVNDLPTWYDGKSDDLTVILGSHRSSSISSSSSSSFTCLPSNADSSKEKESLESQMTSFDSSFGQSCQVETTRFKSESPKSDTDSLVHSVLQSLSIYAGPNFSASAPEPCHLPFPSFLTRRWSTKDYLPIITATLLCLYIAITSLYKWMIVLLVLSWLSTQSLVQSLLVQFSFSNIYHLAHICPDW